MSRPTIGARACQSITHSPKPLLHRRAATNQKIDELVTWNYENEDDQNKPENKMARFCQDFVEVNKWWEIHQIKVCWHVLWCVICPLLILACISAWQRSPSIQKRPENEVLLWPLSSFQRLKKVHKWPHRNLNVFHG